MPNTGGRWALDDIVRAVEPRLGGFCAELLPTIDSTNTELMRRVRAGRTAPTLLVAEVQTAGRGRLGRAWVSQGTPSAAAAAPLQHALTFSLGLPLSPRDWSGLSLAVGVSVARSLHPALQLKWPNDLWFQGRKLAGILIETAALADQRFVVVGIGVNITAPLAAGLSVAPAWLQELLPQCDAPQALSQIVPALVSAIQLFEAHALGPFLEEFKARDLLCGRAVVLSDGVTGTAQGIDSGGGLLVHTSTGMKTITSAEVSVRAADHAAGVADRCPPP
jgi:BirA family biotin operon repressor/biotin-[acetyl-CoA-carboxylase] ligase